MLLAELPDEDDGRWDVEHRKRLFAWAAERVRGSFRESTWQAFWRTGVQGEPADTVARDLGISLGAVYIARSRVLARVRETVAVLEGDLPSPGPPARDRGRGARA